MRISSSHFFDRATRFQGDQTQRLFDLSRQLATGKRFAFPSDNPLDATAIRRLDSKIDEKDAKARSLGFAKSLLESGETSLISIQEILQRARSLAVELGSGTFTTADRVLASAEVNELLEAALRLGNTESGGRGVFAGAKTDAPAFAETRNAGGDIVSVNYQGDDTVLEAAGDGRNLGISIPGSAAFAAVPRTLVSPSDAFDGAAAFRYADREIAANFLPSSGVLDGTMRIHGVLVNYDLDGDPTSGEGDSLLDLARKINQSGAGASATVEGAMQGTATFADPTAAVAGVTAGTLTLGGAAGTSSITVTAADSMVAIRDRVNTEASRTGVTAAILDAAGNVVDGTPAFSPAAGPFRLRLAGGVEVSDNAAADSNAFRLLGLTTTPAAATGQNLAGTVTSNYRLVLANDGPGVFSLEDASGSILRDLGFTDGTAAPNNIAAAAVRDDGSVFDVLVQFRDDLRAGNDANVRSLLDDFDSAIDSVVTHRTTIGARVNAASAAVTRLGDEALALRDARARIEEADLAKVIADLKGEETANEAALRALSGSLGLSLLDFLG